MSIAQVASAAAAEHYSQGLFWTAGALTCLTIYAIIGINTPRN